MTEDFQYPFCEVCGEKAIGVASSALGPISHAYCEECVALGREPWDTLVGCLWGIGDPDAVAEWVRPFIDATCSFYGKTEEELWAEIEELDKDYFEYCERQQEKEEE